MSYHTVIVVGNVGADAEMRFTPAGQAVTSFSLAANHEYTKGQGEKVKQTTWFRVQTWGKLAEICNLYVAKGAKVLVEGRLNSDPETGGPRMWTGQDGVNRANYEITAQTVRFLSKKEGSMTEAAREIGGELLPEDDIPF